MTLSSQESGKACSEPEITTDFGKYATKRRYFTLPLPDGGSFRVQSLKRSEVMGKMVHFPPENHFDALITLAVVDENGDTIWPCSQESFAENLDLDWQVYEALLEGVKAFCTNSIDYEALAKNSGTTQNGASKSGSPESSVESTSTSS